MTNKLILQKYLGIFYCGYEEEVSMRLQKYLSTFAVSSSKRFSRIFASCKRFSAELHSLTITSSALVGLSTPIERATSSWRANWRLRSVISSILDRCSCTRLVNSRFSRCRILHSSIIARLSRSVCT